MTPSTPTIMGSTAGVDVLTSDIKVIETLLRHGHTTSRFLVEAYLAQIEKHDNYLHAMIQITPKELLFERADSLDKGRRAGKECGPLYGIPIIVKDTLATHPSLGLGTTAGSLSLVGSKPRKNSKVVEMLLASGAIILGKTNLSEFSNSRGSLMPSGWSAVGGQTQSAYVRGGLDPNDSKDGHSSTSGSSSGSAVAVSAGYAPASIGTETDGSLIVPAGRAALYTIKPTIGLVPQAGIVPISSHFDSAGPMTKSVYDLAILLDAISQKDSAFSFTSSLTGSWSDISVGALDPSKWIFPDSYIKPVPMASEQTYEEIINAYEIIRGKAKSFTANVPLSSIESFKLNGTDSEIVITRADLKKELNAYLQDLEESQVRSLKDIIDFNIEHATEELPPRRPSSPMKDLSTSSKAYIAPDHPRQDEFLKAQEQQTSPKEYERHLAHLRRAATVDGIDRILDEYGLDVIIGPADSFITSFATGSGYPIAAMPLSYLRFNGRPLGVAAIARKNQEALLVKVMSAWEATFPSRQPPRLAE